MPFTDKMVNDEGLLQKWQESVLATLGNEPIKVKKLRKQVLLSLQCDEDDKVAKKTYKRSVQALEEAGELSIDEAGLVSRISKKRKTKDEKKKSKKRKKEKDLQSDDNVVTEAMGEGAETKESKEPVPSVKKNKPCKGNPSGITRLFLGNLPFAIDETGLEAFFENTVTHIKWITDKETGKFYGSAFVEIKDSTAAAAAVAKAGHDLIGRPIKVNYAPARPGDPWPPAEKIVKGGASGATTFEGEKKGGGGPKPMSEKPEHCVKLFIGNLSYEIDDEGIAKFFANVDAEVRAVRWLHHKDSGDFKGCGFVEFWNTEACDKAATLNGKNLLGRPIRIDWSD